MGFQNSVRDARHWRISHSSVALLFALLATLLAFAPQWFPAPLALGLGMIFVFLLPGYLLEQILFAARELTLTRLPIFFVFSLAVWAIPATALQVLGADWFAFRVVFVSVLWALTLGARILPHPSPLPPAQRERFVELALALICVGVALEVARGPRDGDDWMYLQIIQQFMASDPFQIRAATEVRYSIRYAVHVWIFLQAFLGQWLNADVVTLVREILPTLLAPLGLVSFFAWGKTLFGRGRAALLAVAIQLAIVATFARGDAWGLGFFARAAQDKFLVWLVILPVALLFAWRYLGDGKFTHWFAYGAVILAAMWVHPVSVYLVMLTLGGFALFNLISRAPFPRRRWLVLTIASLPALLAPVVIRATTLPAVFTVNTPEVAAYLRLSVGRLLFQPPFYIADPALLSHPAILFALAMLVWFAPRVRTEPRIQFLWGSTLVPLALLFNPYTARLLGEMLTPWQLWRMTWNIPAAFLLTETILCGLSVISSGARNLDGQNRDFSQERLEMTSNRARLPRWQLAAGAVTLIVIAVGAVWLANQNFSRSWRNLTDDHALAPAVEDMLQTLRGTLHEPSNVLLPREMTRYASAYTYNAVVMSNEAHTDEDTRGKQIDRFYDPKADPKFLNAFLDVWQIDYAVVPNNSLQNKFLQTRPHTQPLYHNAELSLYRIER
ncbi:MAG: hypothetical protein HY741_24640 [Chloroflexi bacterium]|nr:hypothetical protein [Chloroflexota bacterium]